MMKHSLSRSDQIQLALGVVFGISLFLPWYGTDPDNPVSNIEGMTGDLSAWDVHPVLRWVFLAAVAAAVLSAWQTLQGHETEWRRGEMGGIVSAIVAVLVLYVGLIDRPGVPSDASLEYGWFIAAAASLAAMATAMARLPSDAFRRQPRL